MKIRAFFHSIKESFHNVFSHPLLTLASITTMTLMLTLLGIFTIFSLNVNQLVERISQEPPVEIFMKPGSSEEQITVLEEAVKNQRGVLAYTKNSSEDNFNKFKLSMGEDASALDYFDSSVIPASLVVKLKSPDELSGFKAIIEGVPGVERLDYSQSVADALIKVNHWVRIGSMTILIILSIISFFIISNMVRISVFSRGAEIEIMKYIGATNAYIRIPYILEGAIIGLFGALIACVILYFSYTAVYNTLMSNTTPDSSYAIQSVQQLGWKIALLTGSLGMIVGMLGSLLSVRRHIRV